MAESPSHRHPHLERGEDAYEFRPPPKCCLDHFNKFAEKQRLYADSLQEEAVHAERRRVVLTAVEVITTYGQNIASVLTGSDARLAETITKHGVDAIRMTGCICPSFAVDTFGGERQVVPGHDHRCGMHEEPR